MSNYGEKIKALRERKGLTLHEVAEISGLSISFLSKLETGKVGVSIANLDKISDALRVKTAAILDEKDDEPAAVSRKAERIRHTLLGSVTYEEIDTFLMNFNLNASIFYSNPGDSSGERTSHAGMDELHYIIKGNFDYAVNEKTYRLSEGDTISHRSEETHAWKNVGNEEGILLVIATNPAN